MYLYLDLMKMARAELPFYAREWLKTDEKGELVQKSLGKWKSRLEGSTFTVYYTWLHRFLHSLGKSPDEAIEWAKQTQDKYEVLDVIQASVNALTARYNTKRIAYATLRSFFMHNRVDLPADKQFRMRGDEKPTERNLTPEHVRMLLGLAVQPWRSAFLVKWHALLDNQGLVYVSNHYAERIVQALKTNAELVRITMPGRKKMKNVRDFETFIGPEPLAALRDYFEKERGWPKPGEPVWVYSTENHKGEPMKVRALQEAWMRLLRRAKLVPAQKSGTPGIRYGFNVHNTRDLVISHLTEVPSLKDIVVEYWAGHQIDPLGYRDLKLKPQFVEAQYRLAIPYLSLLTAGPPSQEAKELRDKVAHLELAVQMLQEVSGLKVATPTISGGETTK